MTLRQELATRGFAICLQVLDARQCRELVDLLPVKERSSAVRTRRGGDTYAIRNLLWDLDEIGVALQALSLDRLASEALGRAAFPISVVLFDKTPGANWILPGHQDLVMPVDQFVEEAGFSGWKCKFGVTYVEPPVDVLTRLVALRIHLDDCPQTNGALELIPASHLEGRLNDGQLRAMEPNRFTVCSAAAGDVLLMSPLIVHRSKASSAPAHRRVLHVVYATEQPGKLVRWKLQS